MSSIYFKITKFISVLSLSLLVLAPSHAQKFVQDENLNQGGNEISDAEKQERKVKNIAAINGLLVGYGFNCELPKEQAEKIHSRFYRMLNAARDEKIKATMKTEYEARFQEARDKGPSFSGVDCNYIKEEYNKIMEQMTTESSTASTGSNLNMPSTPK